MRALFGCVLGLVLVGVAWAEDKPVKVDAKQLVGKWELAELPPGVPKGAKITIEMAEAGKLTVSFTLGDKTEKMEGTYKVSGNKITLTTKKDGKDDSETETVTSQTDDELVTVDDKGKKSTLKRIKK